MSLKFRVSLKFNHKVTSYHQHNHAVALVLKPLWILPNWSSGLIWKAPKNFLDPYRLGMHYVHWGSSALIWNDVLAFSIFWTHQEQIKHPLTFVSIVQCALSKYWLSWQMLDSRWNNGSPVLSDPLPCFALIPDTLSFWEKGANVRSRRKTLREKKKSLLKASSVPVYKGNLEFLLSWVSWQNQGIKSAVKNL